MTNQRKYIYGIIEETELREFSFRGVEDAQVYWINHRNIAAIVSDIGLSVVDPTRKNVRAHTVVQDELLKTCTLLPMGFGMVAVSEDEVLNLLNKNYPGLCSELGRLTGKVEVALKVFWDQETVIKELQGGSPEFTRLQVKIKTSKSTLEAQKLLVEAGRLVERLVTDWKSRYADRVYAALKGLSFEARINNPLGIKNLLNASFLIDRSRENDFQREVFKLDSQYRGRVNFRYIGPLAPYNFVSLKLEP